MKIGFPALNTWLVCGFDFRRLVFLVWFGMGLGRVLIIFFYSNAVVWERGGGVGCLNCVPGEGSPSDGSR